MGNFCLGATWEILTHPAPAPTSKLELSLAQLSPSLFYLSFSNVPIVQTKTLKLHNSELRQVDAVYQDIFLASHWSEYDSTQNLNQDQARLKLYSTSLQRHGCSWAKHSVCATKSQWKLNSFFKNVIGNRQSISAPTHGFGLSWTKLYTLSAVCTLL